MADESASGEPETSPVSGGRTSAHKLSAQQSSTAARVGLCHHGNMLWLLLLMFTSLLLIPGCGGCTDSSTKTPEELAEEAKKKKEEELKKKKKEKKADFEFGRLTLQPGTRELSSIYIKPGHWISAVQTAKTNNFDFLGEMDAAIVDREGQPINVDRTQFRINTTRPAALPKGQLKYLDMTFFVPHAMRRARLNSSLRGSYAGSSVNSENTIFNAMPPYQYVLLVLAQTPERYGYLKSQPASISVPWSENNYYGLDDKILQYSVISTSSKQKPILLPSDFLTWSSMAYLFWDDVNPDSLSPEQQQALVDWIHWGGQLIISGPGSLAGLKESFLSPYLPATAAKAREYASEDLDELNDYWTLATKGKPGYPLRAAQTWSGVELNLHKQARFVPKTADLVAERQIGLGRIAVSAIHLSQPELTQWPGFDGFLNACLLRRGPRKWEPGLADPRLAWATGDKRPDDPKRVTGVRFFSRDASSTLDYHILNDGSYSEEQQLLWQYSQSSMFNQNTTDFSDEDGYNTTADPLAMGGVASWNSFSPISNAARETLRSAAGVKVPGAWFVVKVVGIYILVIVPVNWLLFYVIGRLEWAWIAAPIVAVVFSVLVVRMAQLDIGFVRAQTEVSVLELQPGFSRGHLTRYLALYTSLGTQYQLKFDSNTAVALPFALGEELNLRPGQSYSTVDYRRFDHVTLNDVTVSSNSLGMLHGEEMLKIKQPIKLIRNETGYWTVRNGSEQNLVATAVIRKADHSFHDAKHNSASSAHDGLEYAWIGPLKSGETKSLRFEAFTPKDYPARRRREIKQELISESLDLENLYAVAENPSSFAPGEVRLVGQINGVLPGAGVNPNASQFRGATLVVAHLEYGLLPEPVPDENTQGDINQVISEINLP